MKQSLFATHNNGFLMKFSDWSGGCGVVVIIVPHFQDYPCPWQLHDFKG
jgi:hypothetical protein